MDPQIKSLATSALLWATGAAASWGVSKGLIPASEQNEVINALVTLCTVAAGVGLGWWKKRQLAPKAMISSLTPDDLIKAVNSQDNGVKVVPQNSPTQAVNQALKEPGK